jgi:hypothetical protein
VFFWLTVATPRKIRWHMNVKNLNLTLDHIASHLQVSDWFSIFTTLVCSTSVGSTYVFVNLCLLIRQSLEGPSALRCACFHCLVFFPRLYTTGFISSLICACSQSSGVLVAFLWTSRRLWVFLLLKVCLVREQIECNVRNGDVPYGCLIEKVWHGLEGLFVWAVCGWLCRESCCVEKAAV